MPNFCPLEFVSMQNFYAPKFYTIAAFLRTKVLIEVLCIAEF